MTIDKLLFLASKIPYFTPYNLQPWTIKKSKTLMRSLEEPSRLIKKAGNHLVKIKPYPEYDGEKTDRNRTFYSIFKSGAFKDMSFKSEQKYEMARTIQEHESGLMDIFLAFLNLFPDDIVEINTNYKFPYRVSKSEKEFITRHYSPDALIIVTKPNLKKYYFVIEFERTKSNADIYENKLKMISENIVPFQHYGLSKYTKVLIIYSYEKYNVFWRPIEYQSETVEKHINAVNLRLDNLISDSPYKNDKFLYLPFHDFHRLDKVVWFDSWGKKVSLFH